ncbi:hypothetical protein [Rhodobacter sp. SY28-1]|uniref:hypothetical protein n=1 Tax=Rhodobacter sp. SY28-1 TaxID=2562317 RepID=UPI0010C04290|nr:hypothetical protein [Rhodobacter sp. SY28-1]
MSEADAVRWQGTPSPLPALLVWAAILVLALAVFALLYWYAHATGRCVSLLLEADCTKPSRSKMEAIFLVLAGIAAVAGSIIVKIAMGFPHERYTLTDREIRVTTGWPLSGVRSQPLALASATRKGNHLHFTGVGEKPITFGPLRPGDAESILRLISSLKVEQAVKDGKG